MSLKGKAAVGTAVVLAAGGGAYAQSQKVTGPVAEYWVSAATTSGFGMGGGQMSRGAMMSMMMRGGLGGGGANHTLNLQLGSNQAPSGAPAADHLPPSALAAGPALPLLTPQKYTPPPTQADPRPPEMQKPEGRMLIYWGCGDHAGPGQPAVFDFAKMTQGQMPTLPTLNVRTETPPSPGRFKTYGEWPNERTRAQLSPEGSLVGSHTVKGNYSPQINFSLGPNQDFLAPLTITGQEPTPMGGTRLTWNAVPGSTGYSAWLIGASGERGGGGDGGATVVMWTSSQAQAMMGALMDYIPPAEARRLVAAGAVMSPQTTTCTIPSEVVKASPAGLLSMIAYGDEVNLSDPPRPGDPKTPWNISWRVKVRFKSTTGAILGMNMSEMGGDRDNQRPQRGGAQQQQQKPPGRPSMGGILGGAIRGGIGF